MRKQIFHSLLVLSILLLPVKSFAQVLKGSYGQISHFYEKCHPFGEELSQESVQVCWRGERISNAILLWAEGLPLENIGFRFSDLVSPDGLRIDSSLFQIRSVQFAHADLESRPCGQYSDRDWAQFIELGDILSTCLETSLLPFCPNIYWLTIDIPQHTIPGTYTGVIQALTGQGNTLDFRLSLKVTAHTLPAVENWGFHLDLWQYPTAVLDRYNDSYPEHRIEIWSEEHFKLLKKKYKLLANMGQKVITAHIKEGALGSPSMIKWIRHMDGSWSYDFTVFDSYVDSMMNWGITEQISCQSPVGWNSETIPYWSEEENSIKELSAPVGSDLYYKCWMHFLDAFSIHLQKKAWFPKAVLYLDEVDSEKLSWIINMIKSNHADWKIGLAGFNPLPDTLVNKIYDLSMMLGRDSVQRPVVENQIFTFYTSCNPPRPNNFLAGDADPAFNIWLGWHAQKMGYNGFLRWAFDYWTVNDPLEQRIGGYTSGDFSFSYRSSNDLNMNICSSVRLELLREGIEDYEKISILRNSFLMAEFEEDKILYNRLQEIIEGFQILSSPPLDAREQVLSARNLLDEISLSLIPYSPKK